MIVIHNLNCSDSVALVTLSIIIPVKITSPGVNQPTLQSIWENSGDTRVWIGKERKRDNNVSPLWRTKISLDIYFRSIRTNEFQPKQLYKFNMILN